MFVAGINPHATYLVVASVGNDGAPVHTPASATPESARIVALLEAYRPLTHANTPRTVGDAKYKNDQIDATLLARR